jgi:hypothetical protein
MVSSAPQSSPTLCHLPACALALLVLFTAPAHAQERFRLNADAAFRKSGNGVVLGSLIRGTEITLQQTQPQWVQFRLDAWITSRSITRVNRDGFNVSVAKNWENLRAAANGKIIARAVAGALFTRVEEQGGWTHLRRDVWVARSALQSLSAPSLAQRPATRDTTRRVPPAAGDSGRRNPAASSRDTSHVPPAGGIGAGLASPAAPGDYLETSATTRLQATPDGPALGTLEQGSRARVVSRSGDWVRVQVEGWVKEGETRPASDSGALAGVTAAEVRAAPSRYIGKVVDWRVQFLAVRKADELRPEIPDGHFYLLTRGPLPESGFVYVIIPQSQVEHFEAMTPLEQFTVRGTIKAAATRYLPNPVIELISVGQEIQAAGSSSRQ